MTIMYRINLYVYFGLSLSNHSIPLHGNKEVSFISLAGNT